MYKYYMNKNIICILSIVILLYCLYVNSSNIETFDNVSNISGKWYSKDLKNGPITLSQNGNIINASYPEMGDAVGLLLDNKISWKIEETGKVITGKLIKDKNGNYITIIWDNNSIWDKENIPEKIDNSQPFSIVPNLEGKWYGLNMKSPPLLLKQTSNIVVTDYPGLEGAKGTIVNNKIIWSNNNKKIFGTLNIVDGKVESIKWENNSTWKKLKPAVNISGQWGGTGLTNGPLNIVQYGNIIIATYPGYGIFEGDIKNNLVNGKWSINENIINGTLIKNSNNKIDTINWGKNIEWRKINDNVIDSSKINDFNLKEIKNTEYDLDDDCLFGRVPQHLVN